MVEPGKFLLPEDGRSFVFYFTSWRRINDFRIDFGSQTGEYFVEIKYFDQELFRGRTSNEAKSIPLSSPPVYSLKKKNLHRMSIYLERKSGVLTQESPYIFSIIPFS
jgi:hypothetical protein